MAVFEWEQLSIDIVNNKTMSVDEVVASDASPRILSNETYNFLYIDSS